MQTTIRIENFKAKYFFLPKGVKIKDFNIGCFVYFPIRQISSGNDEGGLFLVVLKSEVFLYLGLLYDFVIGKLTNIFLKRFCMFRSLF